MPAGVACLIGIIHSRLKSEACLDAACVVPAGFVQTSVNKMPRASEGRRVLLPASQNQVLCCVCEL